MSSKLPLSVTLMAFVAILSHNLFAASATVGYCAGPGIHYTTIQAAVTATAAPAVISVCPGTYPEQIVISKKATLKGVVSGTSDAAVIVPPAGGLVANGTDVYGSSQAFQILVQNTSAVIANLTVDGTGNNWPTCGSGLEGIAFENSTGSIVDNVVRNQYQTDFGALGGCQNGLAINVESLNALPLLPNSSYSVVVSGNSVRAYQKNGITASGGAVINGSGAHGPAVLISGNYITGLAATGMNWPTCPDYQVCAGSPPEVNGGAGENGIQVGFGATGTVQSNVVNDNIWWGEYPQYDYANQGGTTTGNGASGILIFSSDGIRITSNEVGSAQYGIAVDSDTSYDFCGPTYNLPCGPADNAYLESNKVSGTQVFDAIDLCSNGNTLMSNTIMGSAQSAIHVDDSCTGDSNNNSITHNVINEACAGILEGAGTGNTLAPNTFYGVVNTTLAGDVCPVTMGPVKNASAKSSATRPAVYIPGRR